MTFRANCGGLCPRASFDRIRHRLLAAAAVLLLLLPCSAPRALGVEVSQSGTPTYSYRLPVPPGIAGLEPQLSLAYDAAGANGPVGYGWGLTGTSIITRCHGTLAVDGAQRRGVANSASDKLCLDGQRLIQTNESGSPTATANAVGVQVATQASDAQGLGAGQYREYRTEKDSFARIRAYGAANGSVANGPAYFKVWTKDGRIHEYGTNTNATANATVTPVGNNVVIAWAGSRISDQRGNYIDFQYDQREVNWGSAGIAGREWNLVQVRYTGTPNQAPTSKIVFVYDDRPSYASVGAQDRTESYVLGFKHVSVRRLAKIQTFINTTATAVKAKTFKLSYSNGPRSNRSRLDSIAECVGTNDDICLPATKFEYEPGSTEVYQPSADFSGSAMATLEMLSTPHVYGSTPVLQKVGILTGDFNGDGRTDIIRWGDDPSRNQLWLSTGDGRFTRAMSFSITENLMQSAPYPCYKSMVMDVNADGLVDIVRYGTTSGYDINFGTISCPGATSSFFLSNGDGTFTAKVVGIPLNELLSQLTSAKSHPSQAEPDLFGYTAGASFFLLDVNGDGKVDIVTTTLPRLIAIPDSQNEPDNPCATVVCTQVFLGDGQGGFSEVPTNMAHRTLYAPPGGVGQPGRIVDVDSDGLADIVGVGAFGRGGHSTPRLFRSLGDGNFEELPNLAAGCATPIDFNSDGRNDCIATMTGGSKWDPTPYPAAFLAVSTGAGSLANVADNFPYPLAEKMRVDDYQQGEYRVSADVIVADVDGDGRGDVIRWHTDPTRNTVFLSNGDGTFRESSSFNLTSAEHLLQDARATAGVVVGNFTGRGQTDLLRLRAAPVAGAATTNQLYIKATANPPPDRLTAIVSSSGARTTFTWVPLSNPTTGSYGDRYKSDRGTANAAGYPNADIISPAFVVATSASDNGVGGTQVTEYAYAGLKVNHEGRGSLGFREVKRQKTGPDGSVLTQVSRYGSTHPYIGMTSVVEMWLGALDQASPAVIGRTQTVLCDKTAAAGAESTASVTAPCPSTAKVRRPYVYKTTEQAWDLDAPLPAAAVTTITTTNTLNDTGDPTRIVVSTTGKVGGTNRTFTKTTDHSYKADATAGEDWVLGRVERTTLSSTVPNLLGGLTASAGTSAYASSITVTGSPISVSANTASALSATKGGAAATGSVTFANGGDTPATLIFSGISAPYSLSAATCTVNPGGSCSVTVSMSTSGSIGGQGVRTLTATGGNTPVTATVSGTLMGSSIALTSNAASSLSALKGGSPATGTVTFANSGNQSATLTMSGLSAPYSVSPASCTVAASGACSVTVSMATSGGIGAQGVQTLTASGGTTGNATAPVSGTLNGSSVATTANNAGALSATYGAAAATGTVTFTNSGNQAVTLTMSGLSAPYSVSPTSCTAAASGGTCTVTVSMSTGGSIGAQGAQTLTASGGTTGAATAPVSGTVNGSSVATTTNNAGALNATKGGSAATGTVTFTNSGNRSATLTVSGLSAPYSVSPASCTVAAGGTCTVTVSMASSGSIGAQGAQTLTASGGTTGAATATVSGTVNGSSVATTANNAGALNATKGGSTATGTVTFTNSGNQPATLAMSGLSAPYSVSPTSCNAVASGGTCTVTVSMATSGSIGAQGAQTLTASGGTTGNATASVSGTLNGSSVSVTANNAGALSATYGAAAPAGTVTFTNSGNLAATLTMSGLSAPYSVTPSTCTAAASGGTCTVTVSMATGGSIGAQGTKTLTATGGTTGTASAAVSGTLNGSNVATTANNAGALSAAYGAAAPSGTVTFTNSGNQAATLTMSGLSSPYSVSPTSCTAAASGGTCTVSVSMATTTGVGAQGTQTLVASGGTTGARSAAVAGTVNGTRATLTAGDLIFGTYTQGAAAPTRTLTFRNDGNTTMLLSLSGLPSAMTATTNSCGSVAAGATCSIGVTLSTATVGTFSQTVSTANASINTSFTASGTIQPVPNTTVTITPSSYNFGSVNKGTVSASTNFTVSNTGSTGAVLSTSISPTFASSPIGGFYFTGGTCGSNLAAGSSCTLAVVYEAGCTVGSTRNATLSVSGNFTTVSASLVGTTRDMGSACN